MTSAARNCECDAPRCERDGCHDKPTSPLCSCTPEGGLPHGEHPYDYGYGDPADCPVHGKDAAAALVPCYCHGDDLVPYCPRHTSDPSAAEKGVEGKAVSARAEDRTAATKPRFAVALSTSVPSDIMLALQLDEIVCTTEDSDEWYAVIEIGGVDFESDETGETVFIQEAYIVDVRRKDWELPDGVEDYRDAV